MAKSKIVKDLASSEIDVGISLKRLKVIVRDLNKAEVNKWVDNELNGYKVVDEIPTYRRFKSFLRASYIIGFTKFENMSFPTAHLPKDLKEFCTNTFMDQPVTVLNGLEADEKFAKVVPAEFLSLLSKGTNIDSVLSAEVLTDTLAPRIIISAVETKILDILCMLEDEFGVLDDLDIDCSTKSEEEIEQIAKKILVIINDNSINIGDNNSLKNSEIINGV